MPAIAEQNKYCFWKFKYTVHLKVEVVKPKWSAVDVLRELCFEENKGEVRKCGNVPVSEWNVLTPCSESISFHFEIYLIFFKKKHLRVVENKIKYWGSPQAILSLEFCFGKKPPKYYIFILIMIKKKTPSPSISLSQQDKASIF